MKLSILAAVVASVFASSAFAGIEVQIGSTAKGLQKANGEITVALTNNSSETAYLPQWQTPLGGVLDDLFSVTLNGEEVAYTGVHAKWSQPSKAQMVELDAGQTVYAKVQLGNFYDMYRTGVYQVKYRVTTQSDGGAKALTQFTEISSKAVQMYVSGSGNSKILELQSEWASSQAKAAAQFQNCTSSRQSQLNTAFSSAKSYASSSASYYSGRTTANITPRYTTWFGSATTSRIATAKAHYDKINSALANQQIVFNCSCDPQYANAYAYVNPNAPYVITLCGAFWPASNTGTDSKAGTIIHETSHFSIVAGTNDNAYGQTAAKSLARSSPTGALNNADSHEYFSENTPAQN
jgi:peptidyl-Lys metalloendopeptidase